jgi:metal-responsive CopG/Arc/MetJ family transcriptional regulator
MKTAISVPDETFARVERRSHALGMSRSQFYTTAVRRYLDDLDAESDTETIDAALEGVPADTSAAAAVRAGRRLLARLDDEW